MHRFKLLPLLSAAILFVATFSGDSIAAEGGTKPFKLWNEVKSPDLKEFKPAAVERVQLPNGMIVFLMEDHELPLIEVSLTMRFGDLHEGIENAGLSDATMAIMRNGGSAKYPGDKLDSLLEDMGAYLNLSAGQDSSSASLGTLKEDFDRGLEILVDVLRNPALPADKLDLWQAQARTGIAKRNDQPMAIASREFRRAVYGKTSPYAKIIEYATLARIDQKAIQAFHQTYFHPNMMLLGVTGDFKKDEMVAKLKAAFESWPSKDVTLPAVQQISTAKTQKVLFVERPSIPQTTVMLGHVVDMRRDSADYGALQVMNEILSGGMASRMFTEVRTKKGLAYSAFGQASINFNRPGVFYCAALTRNEQSVEAFEALKEEVSRIREQGVTEKELSESRESILNSFVFNFDSPSKILNRTITYEFYGYPKDFAEKLLEAIKAVKVEDVNRVAKKYLDAENVVLVGVGNTTGLDPAKTIRAMKGMELVDVTIPPAPGTEPKKTQ